MVFKLEGVFISLHFYGECAQLSTLLGGMAGPQSHPSFVVGRYMQWLDDWALSFITSRLEGNHAHGGF